MNARMKLAGTSAMALALVLTGMSVSAQEAAVVAVPVTLDATGAAGTYLGRIVIGYDAEGAPIYAADNTSTLEGNAVTAQGGTATIDEVLRSMPGVGTRQDIGQPGVAVSVRGMQGQGRVAMTVEGVPQNFRFNGHASEGYAYIDQALLSSISVTRGAAIGAGGSGLAGAVDFGMLRAEDIVDGEGSGGIMRLSYGDNAEDFSRMVGAGMIDGPLKMVAAISLRDSEDYIDGEGETISNTGRGTESLLFRADYDIADNQTINFYANTYDAEFAANSYGQELTSDTFKLGYSVQSGDMIDLNAAIYTGSTTSEYVSSISGTGSYVGRVMETNTTGITVDNTSILSFGGFDVTSTNGFEFNRDELGGRDGGANPTFGESNRYAIYTNNVLTRGALELTGGLRFTSYDLHGELDNRLESGPVDVDDSSLDYKFSVAYQVNDWFQPYVSTFSTMRAPSLQETLQESFHGYGFFNLYLGPNPNLESETSTGHEIGANFKREDVFTAGDSLTARVAYFDMDIDNYITGTQESGYYPDVGPVTLSYYDNVEGTTVSKGLELEAVYASDVFSAALSYATADTELPDDSEATFQPDSTYALTLAGHFLDGALTTGATYSYTAGGIAFDNSEETSSYALLDLFASYEITEDFRMNAKISNAGDETYTPWGANGNGMGRNVFVGVDYRF